MNLTQKLIQVYEKVDHIEKRGHNKNQNYDYVRAADMIHAIRKALLELNVYAEVNMFNERQYTIAREKAPNAPFAAIDVRCVMVFRDADSGDTLTASGVGTGADVGDKAAYKAQTGAIKYALRNAFLIPDEASDPEADESTDENSNGQRQDPYQDYASRQSGSGQPTRTTASTKKTLEAPYEPTETDSKPTREPGDDTDANTAQDALPTDEEISTYNKKIRILAESLASKEGGLKPSRNLPILRKVLAFLLAATGQKDAKSITKNQWDFFFTTVEDFSAKKGIKALADKVEKISAQ